MGEESAQKRGGGQNKGLPGGHEEHGPRKNDLRHRRTACRNYKEDPKAVDDVKDWIIYKYGKQMKEELAEKEKALRIELEKEISDKLEKEISDKLEKEYEEKLEEKLEEKQKESEATLRKQKIQIARKLLSSSSMTISEIANATDLDESEIKKISKEP